MCGSLNGITGAGPWVGQEAELRWSVHPLGGAVCRDHVQYPAFAPGTPKMADLLTTASPQSSYSGHDAPAAHACSYF